MSKALNFSPAKKKAKTSHAKKYSTVVVEGNPLWDCPNPACDGKIALKQKRSGRSFVVCDNQIYRDPTTCQVTGSFFRPDAVSPKKCLVSLRDVEGAPPVRIANTVGGDGSGNQGKKMLRLTISHNPSRSAWGGASHSAAVFLTIIANRHRASHRTAQQC